MAPPSEVLGKSEFFECAAAIRTDTGLVEHGARLSVLVIDCFEDICASLVPAEASAALTAEAFLPEDPSLLPFVPSLLPQVDQWLRSVDGGEFYSLDEGEALEEGGQQPKATAKQKAKAKAKSMTQAQRKLSAAVLAERLETALSALPALNSQLDELAQRQSRLESAGQAQVPPPKQTLHSHLGIPPPGPQPSPLQAVRSFWQRAARTLSSSPRELRTRTCRLKGQGFVDGKVYGEVWRLRAGEEPSPDSVASLFGPGSGLGRKSASLPGHTCPPVCVPGTGVLGQRLYGCGLLADPSGGTADRHHATGL